MSLELDNISHRFGDAVAVNDASLVVGAGEIVCLFGPSGCGKTTLLRVVGGLEAVQKGSVALAGHRLSAPGADTPPEQRPIGFVFQDFALFPHMTVEENVAFGLGGPRGNELAVAAQLAALEIADFANRFPHELSGGQQQRVAIARAIIRKPKALLLDEPFANIDGALRRRLREDLRAILKAENVAVILVTHDPEEALALGDRIALMRDGRIVETASPQALYATPKTIDGAALFPNCIIVEGSIADGQIETFLGAFPANSRRSGAGHIVLRREFITVTPDNAGLFTLVDKRFVGPDWRVRLRTEIGAEELIADMKNPPSIGGPVSVAVDQGGVHVFPQSVS